MRQRLPGHRWDYRALASPKSNRSHRRYWLNVGKASRIMATSRRSTSRVDHEQQSFSFLSEAPRVSRSRSLASEKAWMTHVATCASNFWRLLNEHAPHGWYGRTCLESVRQMKDGRLGASSGRWLNSGMGGPTEAWTLGNSMAVPVMRWIGRRILEAHNLIGA